MFRTGENCSQRSNHPTRMVNHKVIRQLYQTELDFRSGEWQQQITSGTCRHHENRALEHLRALQDSEQHSCSLPTNAGAQHPPPPDCSNQVCPHTDSGAQGPQLLLMENHWGCGSYVMVGLTVFTATSLLKKK